MKPSTPLPKISVAVTAMTMIMTAASRMTTIQKKIWSRDDKDVWKCHMSDKAANKLFHKMLIDGISHHLCQHLQAWSTIKAYID
jgi:hypothetical protein